MVFQLCQSLSLLVIFVTTVHVDFAYRLTSHIADCCSVIGHFAVYYLEANIVIGCDDRSARVGSVLS